MGRKAQKGKVSMSTEVREKRISTAKIIWSAAQFVGAIGGKCLKDSQVQEWCEGACAMLEELRVRLTNGTFKD